jgi:predicted Zn-dependent protease
MLNVKSFFTFLLIFFLVSNQVLADSGPSLIRDAETEKFLRDLTTPIFKTAGLNVENVKVYIVNDESINAFVSGGQNVFINTGLIRKYKTPDALIGVIAHETGHIVAGHLARAAEGAKDAENAMLLTYLLGIGAALGGSPAAAQGILMGGSQSAQRLYMKYTRTQEEAADQHAIQYLGEMQYPATGLINLLEFFESEMVGYKGEIDEYLMSHPVSKKRIDVIKARTGGRNFSDKKINEKLQPQMNRVLAKLDGFIESPEGLLQKYANRNDETSNYIKSIALFRKGEIDKSLNLLNPIVEKNSKDGFLFELKGQILFESGRIEDSIIAYNQAIKIMDLQDSAQSKIAFASAILALKKNDPDLVKLAIKRLEEAKDFEGENPFLFKQLANAYDKIDDKGRSLLALAEFNFLIGDKDKCRKYAKDAKNKLDKSAKTELLRADDLLDLAKKDEKEKK